MAFIPLLKSVMRFQRPLLPSNPFENPPAVSWAAAYERAKANAAFDGEVEGTSAAHSREDDTDPIRDVREVNTVVHEGYSDKEYRRDSEALARERFGQDSDARIEKVDIGELYLLELEEAEYGVRLGLGKAVEKKWQEGQPVWVVEWFKLSGRAWRSKNPSFVRHFVGNRRSTDTFDIKCFRLHVAESSLTVGSRKEKDSKPKLKSDFAKRVLLFAAAQQLQVEQDEEGDNSSSSDEEEGEEGSDHEMNQPQEVDNTNTSSSDEEEGEEADQRARGPRKRRKVRAQVARTQGRCHASRLSSVSAATEKTTRSSEEAEGHAEECNKGSGSEDSRGEGEVQSSSASETRPPPVDSSDEEAATASRYVCGL